MIKDNQLNILKSFKKSIFSNLRVGTFGAVESINVDGTINIQPLIKEEITINNKKQYVTLPLLINVPILYFPGVVDYKPKIGELALIIYVDNDYSSLMNTYKYTTGENIQEKCIKPTSNKKHNLNNAVAICGFKSHLEV